MTNRQIQRKPRLGAYQGAEPADSGSAAKAGGAERLQCRSQRDREAKQLIEAQIKMLQAEIARIQKEEMEKQQQEQMKKAAAQAGDGVNRPTPLNAVDVYI